MIQDREITTEDVLQAVLRRCPLCDEVPVDHPMTANEVLAAFETRMKQRSDIGVVNRALNVFLEPRNPFEPAENSQAEDGNRGFRNALCRRAGGIPVLQSRGAAAAGVPMSNPWKVRLDGVLREGEIVGLYFTTADADRGRILLCVLASPGSRLPEASSKAASGFIGDAAVVPETEIRSDAATHDPGGSVVFSVLGTVECVAQEDRHRVVGEAVQSVKQRVRTTTSVAALTGVELALVTWLRS